MPTRRCEFFRLKHLTSRKTAQVTGFSSLETIHRMEINRTNRVRSRETPKTLSHHRANIRRHYERAEPDTRTTVHIDAPLTARDSFDRFETVTGEREFSTAGRPTFWMVTFSRWPATRTGTHDIDAMLACRKLTTRDNANRPRPTERARKWPTESRVLRASRRPIDGRGAIDISMLLLILSVGGWTDAN